MKNKRVSQKQRKSMFFLYVVFLLVCSIAIVLMPVASAYKDSTRIPMLVSGGAFWAGLIGTVVIAVMINTFRKRSPAFADKRSKRKRPGLTRFFTNKEARIADIAMIISVPAFIISRICSGNLYPMFIFLALFLFSFGMHCMLNGESYIYLKSKVRRDDE